MVDYKFKSTPLTQFKADHDFQPAVYLAGRWLEGDPRAASGIIASYERFGPEQPWGFADPTGWKCSARYWEAWGNCPGGAGL